MKYFILLAVVGTALGGGPDVSAPTPSAAITCERDGKTYRLYQSVPSRNRCEVGCFCGPQGEIICVNVTLDCFPLHCGDFAPIKSSYGCCKVCPKCDINGTLYEVGHSVPVRDPCELKCYCSSDGRRECKNRRCGSCGGLPVEPEIPGECCPKCPVCDINGISYEPGDKLPLGDPCSLSCFCTRERRVSCYPTSVHCAGPEPCPSGTKLVTETVPGECCKKYKCSNVTCDVDGVTYSVGDDIPQKDPCVSCICTEEGPVCGSRGCSRPLPCRPPKTLVTRRRLGECCADHGCVTKSTCEVEGEVYTFGEDVPSSDPCKHSCVCRGDDKVECITERCGLTSSCGGLPLEIPKGECCPKCPVCDINGTSYEPGDRLPFGDPCSLLCTCTKERRIACHPIRAAPCPGPVTCPLGTKLLTETVPRQCCKNYKCVIGTCEVDGVTYSVGDDIPNKDPCVSCECMQEGPVCGSTGCPPPPPCLPPKSLVARTRPGECCPDHSCVTKPTCEVEGEVYNFGEDVPSSHRCRHSCVCRGDDKVECITIRRCPVITECGGLTLEVPEGECCSKCPKCDFRGISYEPGDRLPFGDPCRSLCTCTKERRISCHSIAVQCPGPEPCPSGTELVTETVPGECCKKYTCADVTCEVDGVTYSVGDNIPKENPCRLCHCGSDGEEVCAIIDCPRLPCPFGKVLVKTQVPGRCCPDQKCVSVTCESDGVTYNFGDRVPHEDPCTSCECASGDGAKGRVICANISCPPPLVCPPFRELVVRPADGECCPEQMCSQRCPPSCTRKLCKSNANALCSTPSGGSYVSDCNVTTCKACYYSEEPPRSLPTGCEKYNCEAVKNDANRLSNCLARFGRCIGKQDKRQYGKPESSIVRPRNFKCYAYPCGE